MALAMIGFGRRQYGVPVWLLAAFPLVVLAWITYRRGYWTSAAKAYAVQMHVQELGTCAFALLVGVIVVEVVRRSRVEWFVLPFLFLAGVGVAFLFSSVGYLLAFVTLVLLFSMGFGFPPAAAFPAVALAFLAFLSFLALLQTLLVRGLTAELFSLSDSLKELKANIAPWLVWLLPSVVVVVAPFVGWPDIPQVALGAMMLATGAVFLGVMVWRWGRGQSPTSAPVVRGRWPAILVLCVGPVLVDPASIVLSPYSPLGLSAPVAHQTIAFLRAVGLSGPPAQRSKPPGTAAPAADASQHQ